MKRSLRRTVRAQLRDARVLLQESRNSLILFVTTVIGGALIFHFVYTLAAPISILTSVKLYMLPSH